MAHRQLRREEYTVGWICALPIELAAALQMLDEEHEPLQYDDTIWTLGRIHHHNVVIVCLPQGQTGTVSAAVVAQKMTSAFKSIRIGLMVGVGGGVPSEEVDIRLGDVVISKPVGIHGGVVQYDLGKTTPLGFRRTGVLSAPPTILLDATSNMQANHDRGASRLPEYLARIGLLPRFSREAAGQDQLYRATYRHEGRATCEGCCRDELVPRKPRAQDVKVHYGTIASGNCVLRDGVERDRISAKLEGVLCFEMEAAGLMNNFPCLVIRGICDYADSHKNKTWQGYAAGTAAACAKELLSALPPKELKGAQTAELILKSSSKLLSSLYSRACLYEDTKARNRRRIPGTCEWFTSHALFQQFSSASESQAPGLLYVTADPGCGKSVLSRYLIDDVLPKRGWKICYFFFKDDFEDQKDSLSAMCSMLHQLLVSHPQLLTSDVVERYISRGEGFFHSFENLWKTFLLASQHQDVCCVLDALDECRDQDRRLLIDAVTGVCSIEQNKDGYHGPRFLITSRPYDYIRVCFHSRLQTLMSSIHIQGDQGSTPDAIAEEIQLVLDSRVDEIAAALCLETDERELMRTKLGSVPNRTYLWITLVFDGLMDRKLGLTKADIISLVEHLPQSVYDAYEKILNKSPKAEDARRLLSIVLGAERPLSLSEMAIALAFNDGLPVGPVSDSIIPTGRIRAHIRDLCGLFTIVVDDKVYLLHQTAREFLVHNTPEASLSQKRDHSSYAHNRNSTTGQHIWRHSIALVHANSMLAALCMRYLGSQILEQDHSFLDYAAPHWVRHFCQSPDDWRADLVDLAKDLCAVSEIRRLWAWIYFERLPNLPRHWVLYEELGEMLPLSFASALGRQEIFQLFLSEVDVTDIDPENKEASRNSKRRRLFMGKESPDSQSLEDKDEEDDEETDNNANSDDDDGNDEQDILDDAMWCAAWGGHEIIVKLLLQCGARVDSRRIGGGQTALSIAAAGGQEPIVRLLLQADADVDSEDDKGCTPLWWAVSNLHDDVVNLLLESGAMIDVRNHKGETLLMNAIDEAESLVEILLEKGADPRYRARSGKFPLQLAMEKRWHGEDDIVRLLLKHGALICDLSGDSSHPIWEAVQNGDGDIVRELFETGEVDAEFALENGLSPFGLAVIMDDEAMQDLLVSFDDEYTE